MITTSSGGGPPTTATCWRQMNPRVLKSINARYRLGPPAYLVAFIASFLYPPASLVILALLALTYVLPYSAPED